MSRILPTGLVAFCLAVSSARAAEELLPPFGFRWNDSMARVDAVLHGAKAKIVSREKKDNREVWTVEGLVHPGLRRTLFNFKARALLGVELQYEYPDWTIERYNQRMGEIRKYFDEKYGTGKLVSRSRDTDTDVIQTLVGYQWMVGGTMLELFRSDDRPHVGSRARAIRSLRSLSRSSPTFSPARILILGARFRR